MAAYGLLIALMLVMKLAPDSPLGHWLLRHCVERPMDLLGNMQRHHLFLVVIMAGLMLTGGEMMAIAGPEVVVAYAVELSIYLDAVMVALAVSALATARQGGGWVRFALVRLVGKMRPRSKRPARRAGAKRKPSNDDDPAPVRALAA